MPLAGVGECVIAREEPGGRAGEKSIPASAASARWKESLVKNYCFYRLSPSWNVRYPHRRRGGEGMSTAAAAPATRARSGSQSKLVLFVIFFAATAFVTYMKNAKIFDPSSEIARHFAPGTLF